MQNLYMVANSFVIVCSIHVYAGLHKETPTVSETFLFTTPHKNITILSTIYHLSFYFAGNGMPVQQHGHQKEICTGCHQPIEDRFLLKVMDNSWHEQCLQCNVCQEPLTHSCYVKDRKLFCRRDYDK